MIAKATLRNEIEDADKFTGDALLAPGFRVEGFEVTVEVIDKWTYKCID